jgi:hypothetical protein
MNIGTGFQELLREGMNMQTDRHTHTHTHSNVISLAYLLLFKAKKVA